MWDLNYDKISELDNVLKSHKYAMNKKFGQNFLIKKDAREKIVSALLDQENTYVWEIGPGVGALTKHLLIKGAKVKAFEIDSGFVNILKNEAFSDEENFSLVEGDALKTLFDQKEKPERIIGNLPYNVGSQIIAKLIENEITPQKMVFTLQKEVVDRMMAKEKSKDYSSFSILTQLDYENECIAILKKGSFWPSPNVDSAVILMKKREESLVSGPLRPFFINLVRLLFSSRRKTIKNNLNSFPKEIVQSSLENSFLTGNERVEELSIEKIKCLALFLQKELSKANN